LNTVFQLYLGENKLHFDDDDDDDGDDIYFVLHQYDYLDFYNANTQNMAAGGSVAPFGHIILILS